MKKTKENKVLWFFREGIWQIPTDPSRPIRSFFIEASRVLIAATRGFNTDECFLKSSALTYYSLLSIVPILAVGFGIAKGFGFEHRLEDEIISQFKEYPEVANRIILFAYTLLAQVQGGLIAGVGVVVLLYTVFKLINSVENAFNDIWKVTQGRSFSRKLTDYLATTLMTPIFFAAASSFTIYLTTQLVRASRSSGYFEVASPFISFIFYALPYIFAWFLFSFVYLFLPNAKVNWKCALVAGITAGTVYQLLQWGYIAFQIGVNSYGAIYGSFAALPLFLVWLNMSWLILLAGAEIAYHSEYDYQGMGFVAGGDNLRNLTSEKAIAILILQKCLQNIGLGSPPLSITQLSREMKINQKITAEVGEDLIQCGLLTKAINDAYEEIYLPAINIHEITIKKVCDALESSKEKRYFVYHNKEILQSQKIIEDFDSQASILPENIELSFLEIEGNLESKPKKHVD